jgi:Tol biopolymer transport system component
MTRPTFGGINRLPAWSPDGQYVVFSNPRRGIFQARADGASQPQALMESKTTQVPWSFTPDGKRLAYREIAGNDQIWTVLLEDQGGQLKPGSRSNFSRAASRTKPRRSRPTAAGWRITRMTASYSVNGNTFVAEKPRVWISTLPGAASPDWDLAPDRNRVAVLAPEGSGQAPQQEHEIVMLLNVSDEMRRARACRQVASARHFSSLSVGLLLPSR